MIDSSVERQPAPFPYPDAMARLLDIIRQYMSPGELELAIKACHLALESCQDVGSGTRPIPPLEHALAVTTIMAQLMHVDAIGISAGLVFEAVDAELLMIEQVEQILGLATARVVGSMARLNILERKKQNVATGAMMAIKNTQPTATKKAYEEHEEGIAESKKPRIREAMRRQQAETVRKMFVAMADDPRVVLLKLAYRLHALSIAIQPGYNGDQQEMLLMAQEAREIYAPLAGRLGMSRVEGDMEDLAFEILEPESYIWIRDIVEVESKQWRSYVEQVCGILRTEMETIDVKAEVSGRVKHAYSFYRKVVRSVGDIDDIEQLKAAADINQIHDLIAFRILVDTTTDCYIALGHVHGLWKPKEGRIKDFIANPKPNGYSALHTTIFCLNDQLVEIQIRTHEMHETAEYGVAMHWHYKDVGDQASASAKELLTWLRQLADWQQELRIANTSDTDFIEAVKDDIFQEQIFVFTPKGDVKDLPVGSTPLDFAYRIHSGIGDHCAGARIIEPVDGIDGERLVTRMVSLDYELKSGEIVDIVTSRNAHPTRDWLNFARTLAARSKIRRYLKTYERPINIQIGRERLDRELKSMGTYSLDDLTEDAEHWLCNELRIESIEDLLATIGSDDVRPRASAVKLVEYWQQRERKETKDEDEDETLSLPTLVNVKQTNAQLEVAGVSGLLTKLANCCNPLPGDEIVGIVSRGKGVIVHRHNCRNIARFLKEHSERIINVNWLGVNLQRYHAPIIITAHDRSGLIRDVATAVSDIGANLVLVGSRVSRGMAVITATLEVENPDMLYRLFTKLERVKGLTQVERDLGKKHP
jgi:GTP diphosphokinase / guanosine-3',5'-bis(diphosphate) 3'-diphosphatase